MIFRPKHMPLQRERSGLEDLVAAWMATHPWHVLGLCLGATGLLGYRLGIRS
jgi:hypothetical protein